MKKDFLDELMEELQKLKDEQKKITISVPVAPHRVMNVINRILKNHTFTIEEKKAFASAVAALDSNITPQEAAQLQNMCEDA